MRLLFLKSVSISIVTRRRPALSILTCALVLLAQLHLWGSPGCSTCGSLCRCASHGSINSCSVRSVGCGGGESGSLTGSMSPLRAVLLASIELAPAFTSVGVDRSTSHLSPHPARPPLDHPPRVSR